MRDEGFIGEVHACPKCGSMVLIARPGAEATPSAESAAPVVAVMSDTLEATEPPPEAAGPVAEMTAPVEEAAPVEQAAAASVLPKVVTAAAGVLVIAGAVAVYMTLGRGSDPSDPLAIVSQAAPTTSSDAVSETVEETVLPEPAVDPIEPATAQEPPVEEPSIDEPAAPVLPPDPIVADQPDETEQPAQRVALANPAPTEPSPPVFEEAPAEIDPLAIDFNEVEIVLRKGAVEAPATDEPRDDSLTGGADEASEPSLDERLAAAAQQAGVFVRRGPTNATTGPPVGSALAALAYAIPSIDLHDIPLDEALRLLGDIAGVPVTLDPVALRQAGVAVTKPIDVVGENITIADLMQASLNPLRLGFVAEGPYVTVVRLGADEVRTINHKVDDLVAGDPDGLAELLCRVGKLPHGAGVVDGKLSVTAPLATHYDLVVLCERLRLARDLAPATKYPRSLLSAEPSLTTLAPVLDRRTTFSFVEPTPLADIVAYWRRVTGVSILVDWRALADLGYGPGSTVQCSATNRPLHAALDGVLDGLGLTWAAIDGKTLWLTTRDAAWQPETIEFYPPGAMPPEGALSAVDPVSGRVLIRADAVTQRSMGTP